MRSERFFCKKCHKFFDTPKLYYEKHGLDCPPYEAVAICPMCKSSDFCTFDFLIEKIEIAEKLLFAIMYFNRFSDSLTDVFGNGITNGDFSNGLEIINEAVSEMFDFLDTKMQKKILIMNNNKELNAILTYLKGGL